MLYSTESFSKDFGAALAAPTPVLSINALLHRLLTTEWPARDSAVEQQLLRTVVERLDAARDDTHRLLDLTVDVKHLIDHASSATSIELLLEIVVERERVLHVLRKHLAGTISRTGFLAFVSEQRWPTLLKHRTVEFSHADLEAIMNALERRDIRRLETLCFGTREET